MFRAESKGSRLVTTDAEARQGSRGRPVLIVLIGSVVLLGIYLAASMLWAVVDTPANPRDPLAMREVPTERSSDPPVVPSSALNREDPPPANPAYPVPAVPYVE